MGPRFGTPIWAPYGSVLDADHWILHVLFGAQLWYFRLRGLIFGPQIRDLDPGGFRLGRGPFLLKNGAQENMILCRNWPTTGFEGDLCEGTGLYGAQEAFGQGHFPLNPTRQICSRDFPISRKIPWAPLGPWWVLAGEGAQQSQAGLRPAWPLRSGPSAALRMVSRAHRSPAGRSWEPTGVLQDVLGSS